jgi:RNA polymerase-binding transcription factor DksA
MKQSVRTADSIYHEIKQKEKDVQELADALNEVDRGTLPHRLLQEAYDAKVKELNQIKRTEYRLDEGEVC